MIDFVNSDKMIKISGKVDKPTLTMDSAIVLCSFLKKKKRLFFLNKE